MPPFKARLPFTEAPLSIHVAGQSPALYRAEDLQRVRSEAEGQVREVLEREFESRVARLRQDWEALQQGLFQSMSDRFQGALNQMRELLPQLVVESTARVLGGVEVDGRMVKGVVEDLLQEVAPGTEALEVQLCESDLRQLEAAQADLKHRFPGISLRVNPELKSGDCVVRTRFGVIDGRLSTKLKGLETLLG
jgi:flagellar assembly protein FliH